MRLFVAVDPPPSARAHLAAATEPVRAAATSLRWVPPERWHLTLAFLGEVDPAFVDPLSTGLARTAAVHAAMELAVAGAGRFATVLWAGITGDTDRLARLAAEVEAVTARVRGLRHAPQRPAPAYRPHLTLARSRRGTGRPSVPQVLTGYEGPPWRAERIHLVRSDLGSQPRHTAIGSWRLELTTPPHPTSCTQESP